MIMVRAIVRPEKSDDVLAALMDAGFPAVTKYSVAGRGKQRGIKIGEVTYDEIPKTMLMSVVKTEDKDFVISVIMKAARSGAKGAFGDGKIFVSEVGDVYTISSGICDSAPRRMRERRGIAMKEVIAVIRMNMMNKTKKALQDAGVVAFFAHEAFGRGKGLVDVKPLEGARKGIEEAVAVLGEKGKLYPKRMLTVVVTDDLVPEVVKVITDVNRTGQPGDGKIFVLPMIDAVRVRTGEKGVKSIE